MCYWRFLLCHVMYCHALLCSGKSWYRVMSSFHGTSCRDVSCHVMSCLIMYLVLCSVYINGCAEVIIKFIYYRRILTYRKKC